MATQTRVIEAVADEAGAWLPCTPVLSVVPRDLDVHHVLAALLAADVDDFRIFEMALDSYFAPFSNAADRLLGHVFRQTGGEFFKLRAVGRRQSGFE